MLPDSRRNNFDLLRLLAASQVVWDHLTDQGMISTPPVVSAVLRAMPGVPIFFVISGFLISMSYERCRRDGQTAQYFLNRFLRIYPALWVAFGLGLLTVLAFGSRTLYGASIPEMGRWTAEQLTVVQFKHPGFLLHYGSGVLNGSLWTIPIELTFYALLPILYCVLRMSGKPSSGNAALLVALVLFAAVNVAFVGVDQNGVRPLWYRVFFETVVPYLYIFLLGVAIQRNMTLLRKALSNMAIAWVSLYGVAVILASEAGWPFRTDSPPIPLMILLALAVVSCAYSCPGAAHRILRGNDFSYGTYVYHMLVLNAAIALGFRHAGWPMLLTSVAIIYAVAALSWFWIERPALRMKHGLVSWTPSILSAPA